MDQNYFANKLAQLQEAEFKKSTVLDAFNEKMQGLREYANLKAEVKRQDDLAYKDTTVGRLGLDAVDDPILHTVVNTAARAGATSSRIIGQVASGLEGVAKEGFGNGGIDEDVRAARARELNGEATAADIALLDYAPRTMSGVKNDQTNRDRIKHWEQTQEDLAKTREFFNVYDRVDRSVDRPFQEELKQGAIQAGAEFDKGNNLTGIGILAKNVVSAGVNNPMGAFNAFVENSPQLAAGIAFGLPGTLAVTGAYANDAYNEAIAEYRKKNKGAMPPKEKRDELLMQAAALMAAETVSDRLTLGAGKAISAGIKGAQKAVGEVGEGVLKTAIGIGAKTAASTPVSTAIGGVLGATGEYGTESFQTWVENRMKDKVTSLEEAHLSGAMGAWGGGPVAAAATAAEKLGEKADEYNAGRAKAAEELAKQAIRAEEIRNAVKTGNVDVFLDKNSADYSPDKALGTLQKLYQSTDITPEKKAELVTKASEVINDFGLQIEAIKTQLAGAEGAKQDLAAAEKLLAATDPADTQRIADLTEYVADLKATVADGDLAPDVRATKEQQLKELEKKYKAADTLYTELTSTAVKESLKDVDVDAEIASGKPESVGKLSLLAMSSPESVTPAQAAAIASSPNASPQAKAFFTAHAKAQQVFQKVKSMKEVGDEILYGNPALDQKGLVQYQERFGLYLANGNQAKADREITGLNNFIVSQQAKVEAMTAAMKAYQATNKTQYVFKTPDGTWNIQPVDPAKGVKRKKGEYLISGMSTRLVANSQAGLDAMNATLQVMEAYKAMDTTPTTAVATQPTVPTAPVATVPAPSKAVAAPPKPAPQAAKSPSAPVKEAPAPAPVVDQKKELEDYMASAEMALQQLDLTIEQLYAELNAQDISELNQHIEGTPDGQAETTSTTETTIESTEAEVAQERNNEEAQEPAQRKTEGNSGQPAVDARDGHEGGTYDSSEAEEADQSEVTTDASARLTPLKDAANRASTWLKQVVTRKANAKNQSLLTAIPDLFSTLVSDGNLNRIAEFLPDGLQESTDGTLGKVQALYNKLAPMMQARLRVAHPSKRENTFLDDLLITKDGKIDLDENLKIALTMGGLAYLRDAMDAGLYHDKETINKILGQPKEAKIPSKVVAELGLGYSRYNLVANNIGESVMKSLGIKAQKDAPENYLANMQAALGALALESMQEAGYLTIKEIRDGELQSWYGKTSSEPHMTHKFVSVAFGRVKGKDGKKRYDWWPKAKALHQEFKGETSNLAQMFDVQTELQMPSFDPPGFNQKSIKRSTRTVPQRLVDYLRKVSNTPYTLKKENYRFFANLDPSLAYELMGVDTRPVSEIHEDNQRSVEAKNDGLIRGYELLNDFVTHGIENHDKGWDAEVYFPQDVWNNQRVGVKSAINMQTDKLHRFMFTTKAWETKISIDDYAAIGKFKLRVLEGFGVKTDSKTAVDALTVDWNALEDNKVVQVGVAVLQEQLRDQNFFPTLEQQKAVLAAAKVGGTNAHALDAMMGYAAYKNMEESGADSFTTNMVGEIDGVNNGPILTLFFLGVSNIAQYAEKGGFFKLGSAVRNANVWKANKKNLDIYQTATNTFLASFATTMAVDSSYKSLEYFTGDLGKMGAITSAGRNLAKRPNTAFFFGSGKGSLVSGLQEEFVSKVLGKIEEVAAIKETDAQEKARKELIRNLNSLLPPEVHVAPDTNVEGLLKLRIADGNIGRSLENIFAEKIGKPFATTLAGSYGEVTQLRNLITQESDVMYSIYSHVYAEMKDAMIQDLVQKGQITPEQAKNWDITEGMASELKAILKDLEPVVHSVQSKKDGDAGLNAALPVVKQKTNASDNPKYERTVFFTNKEGKEQKRTVRAMEKGFKEPGVGMLAKTVHSSDSGISHSTNPEFGAVNVHDAKITGLAHYTEVGTELNTATFDVLLSYSPLREVYNARVRQMEALAHLMSDPEFAEVVSVALHNSETARYLDAKKKEKEFIPASDLTDLFRAAQQADMNKLYELSQMEFIDQYGNEGGQYNVTEEDRQRAKRELNYLETNNFIPESVYETVAKATGQKVARYINGTPENRVLSDLDMTVYYRDQQSVSLPDALEQLKVLLASRNQADGFQSFMIEKLLPLVSKDARVILVRNEKSVPASKFQKGARGWTDGEGNVYVLDPSQSHSGLTPELVLHEVMHSVLRHIIDNPRTPEQKAAVAELKKLYKHVSDKVAGTENAKTFKSALSNLQEFVAYGSTNADFQTLLAKIGTKQRNGFTRFVEQVVKLIFPKDSRMSSAALNSALGDLFTHIGELFESVPAQVPNNGMANGDLLAMASNTQDYYTTQQVFDALNSNGTTQVFRDKLQHVLESVVTRLQGPYGSIRALINEQEGKTPLDAWAAAEARGERMFHGKVLAAGVKFSAQEAFVAEHVEAVMSEVLNDKAASNNYVYKEIEKVFLQARDVMKGKINDDLYNFVFMAQGSNSGMGGKSDHMQRFVALSLANQEFNTALGFATARANLNFSGKTILQRVEMLWRAAVDWLSAQYTGTYLGQQANERMNTLVRKLVQVEVRYRSPKNSMFDFLGPIEERAAKAVQYSKDKVVAASQSKFVKENRFMAVQTMGIVAKTVAGDRAEKIFKAANAFSNTVMPGVPGQAIQLMNYLKGPGQWLNEVVRMAKHTESKRKHIINDVSVSLMNGFKDGGAYLKEEDKKAITSVLLRTGAHLLNGQYSVEVIQKLLEDPKALDSAIDKELNQLSKYPEVHYWMKQATGLAWMKVTGWAGVARQNLNAHNIAHLYNTGNPAPSYAMDVIPNLERLIALYGLKHSVDQRKGDVAALVSVMKTEASQGDRNGIRDTLDLYGMYAKESKEKLFKDSEALQLHGWLPEVHNPHVEIAIARDAVEAKELTDRGYVLKANVPVDKNDPDKRPVMLYTLKGAGLPRRTSGAYSFTGTNAKGTQKHNQYFNPLDFQGTENMISMNQIHSAEDAEVQRQFLPNPGFKPGFENRLVPIVNAHGKMVDYRYMMKENLRDDLLERNNDFAHLIGVMAATNFDKVKSREQNKDLSVALHDIYKEDFASNPDRFVQIGTKSSDPELREIWDLLPSNTKKDIRKEWGGNGMWVPKEMVLPLFGYRKYTLSSTFDKEFKTKPEELFTQFSSWLVEMYAVHRKGLMGQDVEDYKKRTAVVVRRTEDMWEEIVREMKDIIVVKTGVVLAGNISSNISLLLANGLNPVKALSLQMEGLRAVMDYQRDRTALEQIKLKLEMQTYTGERSTLIAERNRLEDAIARNPASELIDAGLLPTIVDDVSMEEDPYSYRSALTNWANEKSSKLNKHVVKAGRFVYMSKDSVLYQFLSKSTQYSDFVARYALYKHETTKKKNPVPKKEALFYVSESFVNYDMPMPKSLQYLDDHGMMNFIKYFFSIQRVLAKLVKEKPMNVINMIALNNMLGDFPILTDSSIVMNIGDNPLGVGAFGYPKALPDLMTVQLGSGMFQ